MNALIAFLTWMFYHQLEASLIMFGYSFGTMLVASWWVHHKYGVWPWKVQPPEGSDNEENSRQDDALAKKLRNLRKGKGGF